jgi:hypothetical protein
VNSSAGTLALVPAEVVTVTSSGPALAAAGETVVIDVGEVTAKLLAGTFPKSTAVTVGLSKFSPVRWVCV